MDALPALARIDSNLNDLKSTVAGPVARLVAPALVRSIVTKIASRYYESVHRDLTAVQSRSGLCRDIEFVLAALLALTREPRRKATYLQIADELADHFGHATIDVMRARGNNFVMSDTERAIHSTLTSLLAETGLSYEQVLRDLVTKRRVSWRGTGSELREVLREVMDHLAPDAQVMADPTFQFEDGLRGPSQKQKVRHILKARNAGSAAIANTEASLAAIESIATLARSTYRRGSASAHKTATLKEVQKLKRYVDALLADLLEIAS